MSVNLKDLEALQKELLAITEIEIDLYEHIITMKSLNRSLRAVQQTLGVSAQKYDFLAPLDVYEVADYPSQRKKD